MDIKWQAPVKALEMWKPEIKASKSDESTINIYDVVGEGYYNDGMTLNIVSSILRKNEGKDITVNINSPGGDMFEGLAIYNALKEYKGSVRVKVLGMAASAASIVAMAGDEIEIGESAFFMIHNAWSLAIGNKNDFLKAADDFAKFDDAMAGIYSSKTGEDKEKIAKMMDEETWISGGEAVEMGFATSLLGEEETKEEETDKNAKALRKIDVALAKSGVPRSERRDLIKDLTSTPSAAESSTPCASEEELKVQLNALLTKLNTQA